jgi:class 3 adenylate cyclase
MTRQSSIAKLTRPVLADIYPRRRLLDAGRRRYGKKGVKDIEGERKHVTVLFSDLSGFTFMRGVHVLEFKVMQ